MGAFPQNPKTFSSVLVTEVDNVDPETKRAFGNGARSILYSSLPEFALDLSNFEVIFCVDFFSQVYGLQKSSLALLILHMAHLEPNTKSNLTSY